MNKDIRVSVTLPTHPKTVKLMRLLGDRAFYNLIRFWLYVAQVKPDGDITGMVAEDIEIASDWQGKPGAFLDALLSLRFVDSMDGNLVVHDWDEHNEYASHSGERSEKARLAANARWRKNNGGVMLNDARSNAMSIKQQCPSPYPSPFPNELIKKPPGGEIARAQPSAPSEVSLKHVSSKHFRDRLECVMTEIKQACETIRSLPEKDKPFNPYQAVQKAVNTGKHPDAIRDTLTEMAHYWDTPRIKTSWGWWRFVLNKNSQNAWEKENTAQAEGYRNAIADLARQKDFLSAIGLTIKTIPTRGPKRPGPE
jgi:hypothetical protein